MPTDVCHVAFECPEVTFQLCCTHFIVYVCVCLYAHVQIFIKLVFFIHMQSTASAEKMCFCEIKQGLKCFFLGMHSCDLCGSDCVIFALARSPEMTLCS